MAVRYAEGLHQMPAGKVGTGDVPNFALVHKAVQSIESFFDRRQGVEAVEVVNVHIIGVEAAQAGFEGDPEMVAGGAEVIGPVAHWECGLGRDEGLVALALKGFAEDFFRSAAGVHVGGVKEVDAGFEADVDEATGLGNVGLTPGFEVEELAAATEGAGAETECGYFEAGASQKTIFHDYPSLPAIYFSAFQNLEPVRGRSSERSLEKMCAH